jgi:predicted signal transduction protein with EAL and GGDEF domain
MQRNRKPKNATTSQKCNHPPKNATAKASCFVALFNFVYFPFIWYKRNGDIFSRFFVCCFFRLLDIADYVINAITLSMLLTLIFSSFLHTRDLLRRKSHAKVLYAIFGILELVFLTSSMVCFILRFRYYYWLSLGLALAAMAYLVFSELVNIAARQYAKAPETERYRKMAYIDALSGIANRNAFLVEQDKTFDSDSLYYVVFDINNMKRINDTFGHSEGDSTKPPKRSKKLSKTLTP